MYKFIALISILTLIFRLSLGITSPLWLDEVYGIKLIRELNSFWHIFITQHDNNHLLNSIFLYLFKDSDQWINFRIHSILASILSIFLATKLVEKKESKVIVSLLFSTSMYLNVYATEARGYSLLLMFSLLTWFYYKKIQTEETISAYLFFIIFSILGILSHASFIFLLASILVTNIRDKKFLIKTSPALLFFIIYYFLYLAGVVIAGAPEENILITYFDLFSLLAGTREYSIYNNFNNILAFFASLLLFTLLIIACKNKKRKDLYTFILLLLFFPILAFTLNTQTTLTPRYLIIPASLIYIWISELYVKKLFFKLAIILLISLNILSSYKFFLTGRNEIPKILTKLNSKNTQIKLGGKDDPRVKLLFDFYKDNLKLDNLEYLENITNNGVTVDYIINHHIDAYYTPLKNWNKFGVNYRLIESYPANRLSSFSWYLYKRENNRINKF